MGTQNPFDIAGALAILGQTSVVTYCQHLATFSQPWPKDQPVFVPALEQIQECAEQNKVGMNKWVLGFGSNLSFRQQHSILGTDRNRQPNFYPDTDWFLKPKQKEVGDSKPEAGYYLLDMEPHGDFMNWQAQEYYIAAQGEDYERADERVFSQITIAHHKATGQRMFNDVWHWGRILGSGGYRVCVRLVPDGLCVSGLNDVAGLCVCVARKSAHRALIA